MKRQETRFSYVYEDLKSRIVSGQFKPGSHLPSSRNLCEEYNVGIATITRVLEALKAEKLIDVQMRRAPVVLLHDLPKPGSLSILAQRDHILQVYQTYGLLLPYLLVFAARDRSIETMPHYRQAVKAAQRGVSTESWKALIALTRDILSASHNPLLCDLHTTFELQGCFSYFLEKCNIFNDRLTFKPERIIAILSEKNSVEQYHHLKELYRDMCEIIAEFFSHSSDSVSQIPAQTVPTFEWNPLRGRDYYYARIVRDLTRKIGTGVYAAGTYLPYEAQLAKQYGVSIYTVRKALGLLERRGYTKTLNVKGTMVLTPDQINTEQALLDFTTKRDALTYLYSLQLMVLISYPVAAFTASQFSEDDLAQLAVYIDEPGIALTPLFQMVLKRLTLKPLQVIWLETSRVTEWGFYFAFYPQGVNVIGQLNEITRRAYRCLLAGKNAEFAERLADAYRLILTAVQASMAEKYQFTEALSIQVPSRDALTNKE